MGLVLPLTELTVFHDDILDDAIKEAPRADTLREAVDAVIRTIHGMPEVLECDLKQVVVYVGRAGGTAGHLRQRWAHRFSEFNRAPSSHAVVAAVGRTAEIRDAGWERAAQHVIGALRKNGALCCSNAVTGSNGTWPSTRSTALYVVAHARRGAFTPGVDTVRLDRAKLQLLESDDLPADVIVSAARLIARPDDAEAHDVYGLENEGDEQANFQEWPDCKECDRPARPGNYGFCGYHRRTGTPPVASAACRECSRPAKDGNYGFCGYHRQVAAAWEVQCKVCTRPAQLGNYGFCQYHRR
jgi:hypothetical protein